MLGKAKIYAQHYVLFFSIVLWILEHMCSAAGHPQQLLGPADPNPALVWRCASQDQSKTNETTHPAISLSVFDLQSHQVRPAGREALALLGQVQNNNSNTITPSKWEARPRYASATAHLNVTF